MEYIPVELVIKIYTYCSAKELCSCDVLSRKWNNFSKENSYIWRNCRQWSLRFWDNAEARNPKLSKPLKSYRKEVFRLLHYEEMIAPYKISIEEYILMWKYFDTINN